ncbi:uncharacterized protein LOC131006455 [Salvia miltiorrhiza]|uniref:uncharacterized protein LOC131006455 n=1 Tax=Salvia miltiorrhiza TaxID=226208 RepID=UPI0025AD241C|nr:uncharacterized protein LOC131006455 [Salvia miltiorrhiza]
MVVVDCLWNNHRFSVAIVHGSNDYIQRRHLWRDILGLDTGPTIVAGDFNAVKGAHERSSDCLPNAASCQDFCEFIAMSRLIESPSMGLKFTWSGRKFMPSHVESLLDRVLYSKDFAYLWNSIYTQNLPRLTSDHSPIVLRCVNNQQGGPRFFKFLHMWTMHSSFQDFVRSSWMKGVDTRCPIYLVMVKLKRLREELKTWNKTVFGNVDIMVSDTQKELLEIQNHIATSGYTPDLFDQEVTMQAKVGTALARKNALLQQKCRAAWLTDGDRNSAFFHAMLRYKKKPHIISHLSIQGDLEYDQERISQHIVDYFSSLFEDEPRDPIDITLIEAVIDPVISEGQNQMFVRTPSEEEITAAVFGMDSNSSPGPDGFPEKFFQSCWAIIKGDIWQAVRTFFVKSYLPSGCNSSTMVLLPKKDVVSTVADLRPIVLSNFFFKIISKILAMRLGEIASVAVDTNQFGFISGRSIHDCIMLGSEGVNCMKRTNNGVNMACKIDIQKAFDTLRWDFLLLVLKMRGYDAIFIRWIEIILHSARLSILYNGRLHGYFACSRGVRQGDPLSPILFGIAEDFLSVLFQNCVTSGHLSPMSMSRENLFPTHLLYADDILVFCKASVRNAETIKHILDFYGSLSGQICSTQKSYIYYSNRVSTSLRHAIGRVICFKKGTLPFIYLGVPLFVGRIRASYLRSIHDRIINKFSNWRGRHLSMAGRICLVISVIHSSLTHSMMVYRWPKSLIKELDGCCRNFIWTGDTKKTPSCSVAWNRVCAIKEEGGLGIRSFSLMNKCFLMKRAWHIVGGNDFGMDIMRKRYLTKFGQMKLLTASSSVWMGLRQEISPLINESYCCLGSGKDTNFWTDDWMGYQIARKCGVPHYVMDFLTHSVADYFYDGIWHFTSSFVENFPDVVCDILLIPIGDNDDIRLWKPSLHGTVTAALAYAHHCHRYPKVKWGSWIWENFIPTRRSLVVWRVLHDRLPTFDRLIKQGMITPNFCPFCFSDEESISHIFWSCARVQPIWQELLQWFDMTQILHNSDIGSVLVDAWNSTFSSQLETYWKAGIITLIWFLWRQRNLCIFEDESWDYKQAIKFVRVSFLEIEQNFTKVGHMNNSWADLSMLRNIGIKGRAAPPPEFINVYWWPPSGEWIKVNTDGSALGALGKIAAGGVFRDKFSWVRGCFHIKGGIGYAFEAELLAVITALRLAHDRKWHYLWIESDSTEGNKVADILAAPNMEEGWWLTEIDAIKLALAGDAFVGDGGSCRFEIGNFNNFDADMGYKCKCELDSFSKGDNPAEKSSSFWWRLVRFFDRTVGGGEFGLGLFRGEAVLFLPTETNPCGAFLDHMGRCFMSECDYFSDGDIPAEICSSYLWCWVSNFIKQLAGDAFVGDGGSCRFEIGNFNNFDADMGHKCKCELDSFSDGDNPAEKSSSFWWCLVRCFDRTVGGGEFGLGLFRGEAVLFLPPETNPCGAFLDHMGRCYMSECDYLSDGDIPAEICSSYLWCRVSNFIKQLAAVCCNGTWLDGNWRRIRRRDFHSDALHNFGLMVFGGI